MTEPRTEHWSQTRVVEELRAAILRRADPVPLLALVDLLDQREAEASLPASGPLPPGTRVRHVGPSCNWSDHHWIADRWGQTICEACNSVIEPIPASGPLVEALMHQMELLSSVPHSEEHPCTACRRDGVVAALSSERPPLTHR